MNVTEYSSFLQGWITSPDFLNLDDSEKQLSLDTYRQQMVEQAPDSEPLINNITEGANKRFLRATGRGRVVPNINVLFPNQEKG